MKSIGVCLPSGEHILASFGYLIPSFKAALGEHHDIFVLPEYVYQLAPQAQANLIDRFVRDLDVLIVWHPRYPSLLRTLMETRARVAPFTRVIYIPLGEIPMGASWFRPSFDLFQPGDRILPSCTTDKAILPLLFDSLAFPTEVFPFWVDTDYFMPPDAQMRSAVRTDLGVQDNEVLFLYTGRITAEKNLHGVLHLFQHLSAERSNVRLVLAGPTDDIPFLPHSQTPSKIRQKIAYLLRNGKGLAGNVLVLAEHFGHNSLQRLYAAADVFLNLTLHHNENFGLANVEAMASEIPVIVSDWGGPRDTVIDGQTGFRIPTYQGARGEHVDLWQAFVTCKMLVDEPDLRRRLGQAARKRAQAHYAVKDLPARLVDVINRTVRDPAPARESQLSDFGKRFHDTFHKEEDFDFLPQYDPETMDLYRVLARPYCSDAMATTLDTNSVLFLSTPYVSTRPDGSLQLRDVVWPGDMVIVDQTEIMLVSYLVAQIFATPYQLQSLSPDQATDAINRLLANGVLVNGRKSLRPNPQF